MFKRLKLFRSSSTKRREEESILKRRRLIQQALLASYRLVPGVAGGKGCVSFECFSKPRFFLCHRDNNLIIERYKDTVDYKNEATFVILENMWFQDFFAFECLTSPGWFIQRTSSGLSLQRYDGSKEFKESGSFKLSKKKCLSCSPVPVAKGARVWVRLNNMCFTTGVVTKDGPEVHVVTTKGKLVKYPRNKPEFLAVDKIPNRQDVRPGSRVVAQWHDRDEPYYLATVQGRLGHNKYLLVFDDDDEAYCDLKNIRVLLWTTSALEESMTAAPPPWSSLEDIPRLSSGMLLNNSKMDKNYLSPKKTWNIYRKISVSDQHLEMRSNPGSAQNFRSSASSCRESSSNSKRNQELSYSGFAPGTRLGWRRMSVGTVLERRDRKNGIAGLAKYER